MNNERTDRMVGILAEEWDSFVVIASRVENGRTICFHSRMGNGFAIQQMLEDELYEMEDGGSYGEEES